MIIGIVGHIGSGKDTVGNIITKQTQGVSGSTMALRTTDSNQMILDVKH